MAEFYKVNPHIIVGLPTLEARPLSWEWEDYWMNLAFPLGTSIHRERRRNKVVAQARNELCEIALAENAEWLLFISDDVLAPPRTFELLARHKKHLVTGVYWTKAYPAQPYLWMDLMQGPHTDWKYGDFFRVDWAGCDCLLINCEVLRKVEPPWFNHKWNYDGSVVPANLATEDLYFYTKTRAAGFDLYCDAIVQCEHQDRNTGIRFGMTDRHEQYQARKDWKLWDKGAVAADIGCGNDTPHFGKDVKVVRIDQDPKYAPDILCDVRAIPQEEETFDVVHARHVLEHFPYVEHIDVVNEWARILKIGGELIINVPNLLNAAKEIVKTADQPDYYPQYAFWQLYGNHDTQEPHEFHKCGFLERGLRDLVSRVEVLGDPEITETDGGINLNVVAKKVKSSRPYSILKNWVPGEPSKTRRSARVTERLRPENLVIDERKDNGKKKPTARRRKPAGDPGKAVDRRRRKPAGRTAKSSKWPDNGKSVPIDSEVPA